MTTVVIKCNCKSAFQDELYGHLNRVANTMNKAANTQLARCTSCGKERTISKLK